MGGTKSSRESIKGELFQGKDIAERIIVKDISVRDDKSRNRKREQKTMRRYILANPMIRSAGYDAQRQVLEMEFASDGQICQFDNVLEEIWYRFRSHHLPALFFQHFIMGHYPERKMQEIG